VAPQGQTLNLPFSPSHFSAKAGYGALKAALRLEIADSPKIMQPFFAGVGIVF
jgi:hypothetical protein